MNRDRTTRYAAYALITALGLLHILRLPTGRPHSFTPDSHEYLAGAESILREGRYLDAKGGPQQVWTPATSLLYAGLSRVTGASIVTLIKWVDIAAYLLLALACVAIAEAARIRLAIGAMMLAAILCNGAILSLHNKLLSDPLTFAALTLLLLTLTLALLHPQRATPLLLAALVLASLAILCRYAMLPVIPLVMIIAILLRRWPIALVAPFAVAPLFLTLALLGATRGERNVNLTGLPWSDDLAGLLRLADQVFPARLLGLLAVPAFLVCCMILPLVLDRRGATLPASLWALGYGAFLPIAQATAVPSFLLDTRILLPLYLGAMIATATACESALRRRSRWAFPLALALLLAAGRALRYAVTQLA
ncbi:MAG TPA: hypothetical protein VEK11_19305 [Thermoanaerobaculia bacterium]|nr:hypothetical protein [Thermoanaerobaculia bacterium]